MSEQIVTSASTSPISVSPKSQKINLLDLNRQQMRELSLIHI